MKREGAYIALRVCTITVAAKAGTESTIELNGSTLSYTWEQNTEYLAFGQRSKRIFHETARVCEERGEFRESSGKEN